MGPGPDIIGYVINDCTVICANCLEDALRDLPVTINSVILDDDSTMSHYTCEMCEEVLDPDVETCYNEDCYHCGHRPAIEEAIEVLEQAEVNLYDSHGHYNRDSVYWAPYTSWDVSDNEHYTYREADEILDRAIDHLRELL